MAGKRPRFGFVRRREEDHGFESADLVIELLEQAPQGELVLVVFLDLAGSEAEDYSFASRDDSGGLLRRTVVEESHPQALESRSHSAHVQASLV